MLRSDAAAAGRLRALLDDLGYDAGLRGLRGNYAQAPFPTLETFQPLLARLPERQRVTYETLLLGQAVERARLEQAWGAGAVGELLELGLLEAGDDQRLRTANWSIVSYFGRYFLVSLNPFYPGARDPDATVYIGGDSLTLAGYVLSAAGGGRHFRRGLDLCAGSGIQAILAASMTDEMAAVELAGLAVEAARFNVLLNGVADRVQVYRGSLYEAAPAGAYDLILSNPPFIPVPAGVPFALCGAGGEDGLAVLRPLLEGLPERLAGDGLALVYAEGVGDAEGPFVRSLLSELARRAGLDVQLTITSRLSVKSALVLKTVQLQRLKRDVPAELRQWADLYRRLGASHLYNYVVRIEHGAGWLSQVMAFDPSREERGIEVQPGVVVRPA
jgi:hypothetical protein